MPLLEKITCPHCWAVFDTHDLLWVATHPSLRGDPKLGRDAEKRFLPTRFTPGGQAMDEEMAPCQHVACPTCHLVIPREATELGTWIVSVIGAPAAGKSFYLGVLARTLRRLFPSRFGVSFTDADADLNQMINLYEQSMFGHPRPDSPTPLGELIPKTGLDGDWYNRVFANGQWALYPRPFVFTLRPDPNHPRVRDAAAARLLCLYDNAGESYQPGGDSSASPVTRHLSEASLLLFLFDPTQDSDFRREYLQRGEAGVPADDRLKLRQQHTFLTEAAKRVRDRTNSLDRHDKPLVVVVTKQDLWGHLVPAVSDPEPTLLTGPPGGDGRPGLAVLNLDRVEAVSAGIRRMLWDLCPAVVTAAESFAQTVVYTGASSLGTTPERQDGGPWTVRPADIRPVGVEVPILYGLSRLKSGLFPTGRRRPAPAPTPR